MKFPWKAFLFLLTCVGLAWLLARDLRSADFQALIYQANPVYLLLAGLPTLAGLFIKGMRLQSLARSQGFQLSQTQGFQYQVLSISLAMITPGRAGEFAKVYLLGRERPSAYGPAAVVVIAERILDLLILCLFGLAASLTVLHIPLLAMALSAAIMGLCVLLYLATHAQGMLDKLPAKLQTHLQALAQIPLHTLIWPALLTAAAWAIDGLFQWLILQGIGIEVSLLAVVAINALVAMAGVLSLLPVGLGTMDFSALVLYARLGISSAAILFLVAASRVLGLIPLFACFAWFILRDRSLWQTLKLRSNLNKIDNAD